MTGLKKEHILIAGAELEGKSRCQGGEGITSVDSWISLNDMMMRTECK